MIRALAVAALVVCACVKPPDVAVPDCPDCPIRPACPAVPTVDFNQCPLEQPAPSLVVTEPETYALDGVRGFWCTVFTIGQGAGESDCFRYEDTCEEWRRKFRERYEPTECRRADRAGCIKATDHKQQVDFYRCFPPAQCEAMRASMMSRRPDLAYSACRDTE